MSAHVILQKQTFNTKEKRDIIADIFKTAVSVIILVLFVKIIYALRKGNTVKPELIVLPVVLSLAIYFINTTLPYKINFF